MEHPPLKTFIIYARADLDFKSALRSQLRPLEQLGVLEVWDDSHLLPGEEWEKSIEEKLDASDLVLMLVSAASLFSDFIQKKELKTTLERKQRGVTQFIPILVRDCLWDVLPGFKNVQMLPLDDKRNLLAVEAWISHSSAWAAALRELNRLIPDIQQKIAAEKQALEAALAAQQAAARAEAEARKKQQDEEKAEKLRHGRDEAAWKKTLAEVALATTPEDKIDIYQTYLEDHHNHRDEAEAAIHENESELALSRKLKEKREQAEQKRLEAQRLAEEEARRKAQEERKRKAAEEKRRQEEDERRQREADEEQKRLEAQRLAEEETRLKAQEERKRKAAEEKHRQEEAERQKREAAVRAKTLPDMVLVQGGTFQMGEKGLAEPVHAVTLSDFYIGKYAVTFEEYDRFCAETKREKPGDQGWGRGKRPVINISWDDAQAYCAWLSKTSGQKFRLPTEAEWEYAARGGNQSRGYAYAGSNNLDEVGWCWENSGDKKLSGEWKPEKLTPNNCKTHPVGEKKANELGLHDMSGNVWEWCEDWYGDYPKSAQTNPKGPASGSYRVGRGGSWLYKPAGARVAYRIRWLPDYRDVNLGFRLARTL